MKSRADGLFAALLEFFPRDDYRPGRADFPGPFHSMGFEEFGLAVLGFEFARSAESLHAIRKTGVVL